MNSTEIGRGPRSCQSLSKKLTLSKFWDRICLKEGMEQHRFQTQKKFKLSRQPRKCLSTTPTTQASPPSRKNELANSLERNSLKRSYSMKVTSSEPTQSGSLSR